MPALPSRDARLKAAVREIGHELAPALAALDEEPRQRQRAQLAAAWSEELARPACDFFYLDSDGDPRPFSLDVVLDRLLELSALGRPSRARLCPDDDVKLLFYEREQRLRNRVDREYGAPTPFDTGPLERPVIDPRPLGATPTGDTEPRAPEHARNRALDFGSGKSRAAARVQGELSQMIGTEIRTELTHDRYGHIEFGKLVVATTSSPPEPVGGGGAPAGR